MPIFVKDFSWTQSESLLCVSLPLKGTKPNVDVLRSLEFFKVFEILKQFMKNKTKRKLNHLTSYKRFRIHPTYLNVGFMAK